MAVVVLAAAPMVCFGQQLSIQMEPTKTTVILGEPVWVDVIVTNVTQKMLYVDFGPPCRELKPLKVEIPGAEPGVPFDRLPCGMGSGGSCGYNGPSKLAPGETISHRYVLDGDFQITHPGNYQVQLEKVIQYADLDVNIPITPPMGKKVTVSKGFTLKVEAGDTNQLLMQERVLAASAEAFKPLPFALAAVLGQQETQSPEQVSQATAEGLALYPVEGMEPIFLAWMKGTNFDVYGLWGLKRLRTEESRVALVSFAELPSKPSDMRARNIRYEAVQALGFLGDRTYLPLMERMADDWSGELRSSAPDVRSVAIRGMGLLGGEPELGRLTKIARSSENILDRQEAVRALGYTGSLKAVPVLIDLARPELLEVDYQTLTTLTHLAFPKPDGRPANEVQAEWRRFWQMHQQGVRAYGPYECQDLAAVPARPSLQDAGALIQVFAGSQNSADLKKAVDAVQYVTVAYTGELKPDPEILTLWLKLLAAIDSAEESIGPNLKTAYTKVFVAGVDEGPSGVPLPEVKDPALLKRYEDAVAENERRRLASNNFSQIERSKELAHSFFWMWAGGLYHGVAAAQTAVVRQAETLGCSDARAEWIRSLMAAAQGSFPPNEPRVPRADVQPSRTH